MSEFIMLKNVRNSFPHLFTRPVINGDEGKCGCVLMLDNKTHAKEIADLNAAIEAASKDRFKGKVVPKDKWCLRPGEDKGRDEYAGYHVLSANSKDRPIVVSNDGRSVIGSESENHIYAGCHVNAKVRLWVQDNQYGKRVNAELVAIQFAADGDPLDGTHVSPDTAMDGFGASAGTDENGNDDDFLS